MAGKYLKSNFSSGGAMAVALKIYLRIGGAQRAAAFAYYAFFSFFPLLLFSAALASVFAGGDREEGSFFGKWAPLDEGMSLEISKILSSMAGSRWEMMVFVALAFFWGAFRFFNVLVRAVNRAWGTEEKRWWNLPVRDFILMGITGFTLPLGLALPMIARMARHWIFSTTDSISWVYDGAFVVCPLAALFLALSVLYRLAPYRSTTFREVWSAALAAAAMLCVLESLFGIYLRNFSKLNLVYGAFGGMMALLMWIYLSGCIVILGACLSAAQAQVKAHWWSRLW